MTSDIKTAILSNHPEEKITNLKIKILNNILEMAVKPNYPKDDSDEIESQNSFDINEEYVSVE